MAVVCIRTESGSGSKGKESTASARESDKRQVSVRCDLNFPKGQRRGLHRSDA